jgi:uncharacterized MAPEG superfamily protein
MTADLTYLVWAVALTIVQVLVASSGTMATMSLTLLAGNRDKPVEGPGWVGRAQRAHRNMLESLVLFAALVLAAHVTGRADATTALGAALFFYGRLAYWVVYLIGVPWLRTAVWAGSLAGILMILFRLL